MNFSEATKKEMPCEPCVQRGFEIPREKVHETIHKYCKNLSNNVKVVKLSEADNDFIEKNSETIYNAYMDLREAYEYQNLFAKVDYNGFLDIFLKNVIYGEKESDSDDEQYDNEDGQ